MEDILVIPVHGPAGTVTIPMARHIGPHRIILVHPWNEGSEADKNCHTLVQHFTNGLKKDAREPKHSDRRGRIRKNTSVDVEALDAYISMKEMTDAFRDFLLTLSSNNSGAIIHIALLDDTPIAYAIAAFSVSAHISIYAYTAQVGYDIRRQHSSKFNPSVELHKTITEIPLLNNISNSIRWLNAHEGSRKVLAGCYSMLTESKNIHRIFKTKEVANFTNYSQSRITNHLNTMRSSEGMKLIERQQIKTNYRLTELGQTVAPFILDKVPTEASNED